MRGWGAGPLQTGCASMLVVRRRAWITVLAALATVIIAGAELRSHAATAAGDTVARVSTAADLGAILPATVSDMPSGRPLPSGFVGVSAELKATHAYTSRDPDQVNPVLVDLL